MSGMTPQSSGSSILDKLLDIQCGITANSVKVSDVDKRLTDLQCEVREHNHKLDLIHDDIREMGNQIESLEIWRDDFLADSKEKVKQAQDQREKINWWAIGFVTTVISSAMIITVDIVIRAVIK